MRKSAGFVIIIVSCFFISGCYYDKDEALYKNYKETNPTSCDTVNLTYTAQIKTILDANCISCHSTGSGHAAILDNASDVMSAASGWNLHDFAVNTAHQSYVTLDNCSRSQLRIWSANPVQ